MAAEGENALISRNILLTIGLNPGWERRFDIHARNFLGGVFVKMRELQEELAAWADPEEGRKGGQIYACGDITHIAERYDPETCGSSDLWFVVREFSEKLPTATGSGPNNFRYTLIDADALPQRVPNLPDSVFVKTAFDPREDWVARVTGEHVLQQLTEGRREANALRTGIYLSRVEALPGDDGAGAGDAARGFHLLRCSANLRGPTDNFRATDELIVTRVNALARACFEKTTDLNHVLAQVYENSRSPVTPDGPVRERKAKISAHSDKTKDMPREGLIAFVTFYRHDVPVDAEAGDAVLTKLRFRRKAPLASESSSEEEEEVHGRGKRRAQKAKAKAEAAAAAKRELEAAAGATKQPAEDDEGAVVDITLYPGSMLIISLSTNRLYTHEIVPSSLPMDRIPTRLGYVIRCSNTKAVFKNGQTYLAADMSPLGPSAADVENELKELYKRENGSSEVVAYPRIGFSMNDGDYLQPLI